MPVKIFSKITSKNCALIKIWHFKNASSHQCFSLIFLSKWQTGWHCNKQKPLFERKHTQEMRWKSHPKFFFFILFVFNGETINKTKIFSLVSTFLFFFSFFALRLLFITDSRKHLNTRNFLLRCEQFEFIPQYQSFARSALRLTPSVSAKQRKPSEREKN